MRFFVAFFVSLVIYLLLAWFFMRQFPPIKIVSKQRHNDLILLNILTIPKSKQALTSSEIKIKEVKAKEKILNSKKKKVRAKKQTIKKKVIQKKVKPKVQKRVVEEEVLEEPMLMEPIEEETLIESEVEEMVYSEASNDNDMVYIEEPFITKAVEPVEKNSDDLASFLSSSSSMMSSDPYPNSKIKKLYGSAFHTFTPAQKEFIENNLDSIQRITQELLTRRGYPEGADINRQEGTNIVSFNLHPNGDISNLRLKQRIGARPLDENTLSLIRSAYKDYPYPATTTQIVFYVTYSIYSY